MSDVDWPRPPIWLHDLPLIRELLSKQEYVALLRRLVWVMPDGPLVKWNSVLETPSTN